MESISAPSQSSISLLPDSPALQPTTSQMRKLLLIYIHGFLGDETSFKAFPKHVHDLLTTLLASTHTVHSKIYPRYKTRRSVEVVAEELSVWLTPHENETTDVVLIGHSMGGILAAEVILLPSQRSSLEMSTTNRSTFRHRILGSINLDVPFLGIHPSVISSGLASIFKSRDDPGPISPSLGSSAISLSSSHPQDAELDPNFNPPYANDSKLPSSLRPVWKAAGHFLSKYSVNPSTNKIKENWTALSSATSTLVRSHVEFGGAMADYKGLWKRYSRIRALENGTEERKRRFVSYWTACNGPKQKPTELDSRMESSNPEDDGEMLLTEPGSVNDLETYLAESKQQAEKSRQEDGHDQLENSRLAALSLTDFHTASSSSSANISLNQSSLSNLETLDSVSSFNPDPLRPTSPKLVNWPSLPPSPKIPPSPDLSIYSDKLMQEAVLRQYKRELKAYNQTIKDRKSTLEDRKKVEDKLFKASAKATQKQKISSSTISDENGKNTSMTEVQNNDTFHISRSESQQSTTPGSHTREEDNSKLVKPPKEKHFCILPPKDKTTNLRDASVWIRVPMGDVDEVAAHCGIFDGRHEQYEMLVGDVAGRIERWVKEDVEHRK